MKNNREDAMESLCEGLANKPVSFTAYHGGVEPDMTPDEGRAFYLTDDYDLAHLFARREVYDDGLYVGEIPTVFTFKGTFNNPYYLTDDEYDSEGQDSNIDYEKWVEMGVDGLVYEGQGGSTYYIVIDLSTIKLVDKKVYWEEEIKDDDDIEESVNNSMLNVLLESNILTEDIAAVKKYFPKVPEEKIQTLIELDPTYQGGDNLGKFGKWILGLYNKGQLKDEDFYKVPQYLTTFKDNLKKIQNKDIMSYKTLPDLAQAIQPYEGQKDVSKKQQVKQLKSDEAEKVLDNSVWLIVHPKTHKADCYYGANTKWCTASKDDDTWFDEYNDKGPLFILINKKNGKKYQFHFETLSFMNELDRPVAPEDVIGNNQEVSEWFIEYCQDCLEKIVEHYNEDAYEQIYNNGIYCMSMSVNEAIEDVMYTDEKTLFDTEELASWYDDSKTAFEFWNGTIRNYLKDNPDFHEECEEAVVDYTDENAFISDIHTFLKEGDLYANKDFQLNLFSNLGDIFNDIYDSKIEELWKEAFGYNYDIDGGSLYFDIDPNEIVQQIYESGEIERDRLLPFVPEDEHYDYYELDKDFQKAMEKTIIQTIKDWTKSENQMEFDFAAESVMKYKNPFLED